MTSTELVQSEIRRFLCSPEPEVLCITGDWGVGKTYTWQKVLDEAKVSKTVALTRYSYASLFGINSLDGLKQTIFENIDILDAPPETALQKGAHGGKALLAQAKKLTPLAAGIPVIGKAFEKAGFLYFSLVRDQIVCIDDLERRGNGLDLKDVFGLVSFLREQRHCKVMLLLNSDELGKSKAEFDTYFEKVIDARLVFAPTASEAVRIALTQDDPVTEKLRESCELLGISNIRVIKKIERLVRQAAPILAQFDFEVTHSAIRALALFGWSKFQPRFGPPIDFIRGGILRHVARSDSTEKPSPEEQNWDAILTGYQFTNLDGLDHELWKFVDTGVLDRGAIEARGQEIDAQLVLQRKLGSFDSSWRPFHDSFDDNFSEVVDSLVGGAKRNSQVVSLTHLNDAVRMLRALGCQKEAKEVLDYFVAEKPKSFWEKNETEWLRSTPYEDDIALIMKNCESEASKVFSLETDLIEAGRTYNQEKIAKLSTITVDEYYRVLKSKKGDDLRTFVLAALEFRRIGNASVEMREVIRRMEEALKRVASESPLNAIRVKKYGIEV